MLRHGAKADVLWIKESYESCFPFPLALYAGVVFCPPPAASQEAGNGAASRAAELACPLCSKRYKKKKYLTNHIAAHTAGKRYCCERCGRAYLFKGFMLKHMLAVHNMPHKATTRSASLDH